LTVDPGELFQLNATVVYTTPVIISDIFWTPADSLSCVHCFEPTTSTLTDITFTATVTDVNGCQSTDEVLVQIDKTVHVYIPNVFSPDDDGDNDILLIFGDAKVEKIRLFRIYDRWGELVHEAENFEPNDPNLGWDGYLRGKVMDPAVFVYYAEVELIDGTVIFLKGDITLLR